MRAVWSFWSKPYVRARKTQWASERHHWLSWVLSLETARRHYPETFLVTDSPGADILVNGLGLQFSLVSTALDSLVGADAGWWALGKLHAYSLQNVPFVHIDNDVFLWKRLPQHLESADVLTQNPEPISEVGSLCYPADLVDRAFRSLGGQLPKEWVWYQESQHRHRGDCCGIFGGNRIDFIQHYASSALQFALDPINEPAWRSIGDKSAQMMLVEQYLLAAYVDFHAGRGASDFEAVRMRYLFDSLGHAYSSEAASQKGYTHLIANAKKSSVMADRLERRVKEDYPEPYERCLRFSSSVQRA